MKRSFYLLSLFFLFIFLAGCNPNPEPVATNTPDPSPTASITLSATPPPTTTPTPTVTPTPAPLDPAAIFDRVSPAVAFVKTERAFGSGVLLADGYVVTNAHVVWPYETVDLVFPDGAEFKDTPVHGRDMMADLAVLGPIETDLASIELIDGEDNVVGSEVYLIGYPGEVERLPQPTITQGLISRMRQWEGMDISFFQTDALITGGQSGGVFVSKYGDVIGISGFSFTEAEFGLVASAVDIQPRLAALIAGEPVDELGERPFPLSGGETEHEVTLQGGWHQQMYVIHQPADTPLEIAVESYMQTAPVAFTISDINGNLLKSADGPFGDFEEAIFTKSLDVPYLLKVFQLNERGAALTIRSNHLLAAYEDPDDDTLIKQGNTIAGNLDYPGDIDFYRITLDAGEIVNIQVDTVLIDPVLKIDYLDATEAEVIGDDDSGEGLFGLNAELTYQAPHHGVYLLVIGDAYDKNVGGYQLTIGEEYEGAPTPVSPPPTATPLPPGETAVYHSDDYPFLIQIPPDYPERREECGTFATTCYIRQDGFSMITIVEEKLAALSVEINSLDEYVNTIIPIMEAGTINFELIARDQVETAAGPAEILEFTGQNAGYFFHGKRLIYLYEDAVAFSYTYLTPLDQFEEMEPLVDQMMSSFALEEE